MTMPQPDPDSLAEHAVNYARQGLEVFPVNPDDKTPLISQYKATTNPEQVAAWWQRWPDALIGHRVAPEHVILDVDPRHGGHTTWKAILARLDAHPVTRWHRSGRGDGGGHLWWQRPDDRLTATHLDAWAREHGTGHQVDGTDRWVSGIDILHHTHRYSILPPSPHPDTGQPYEWRIGLQQEPSVMPAILADLITDTAPPAPPPPPRAVDPTSPADWYVANHTWADLLARHGWTLRAGTGNDNGSRWRHPTATSAFSATIRHNCLFVYSPNTPFDVTAPGDPHGYTLFHAWAALEHRGDQSAAARAARELRDGPAGPDKYDDLTWIGDTPPPADIDPQTGEITEPDTPDETEPPKDPFFIHWPDFWQEEPPDEEWLIDHIFAKGRGHVVYAQAKQGKSLFVLWHVAKLAEHNPDVDVIYLDYEMTRNDIRDRLEDMGFGPHSDLTRLHYALLPSLPPLDTGEGAQALIQLVEHIQRPGADIMLVVDTTGRAVEGEENVNDTIREFYRWTGIALKRRGVTWCRIDHAGKDSTKGQRGGSAKNDDVDVVWKLQAGDNGAVTLHCDAARMSWVSPRLDYTRHDAPLRYSTGAGTWPAGTADLARQLDELGLPADAGRPAVRKAMRDHAIEARNDVVSAAIRYRKSGANNDVSYQWVTVPEPRGQLPAGNIGDSSGTVGDSPRNMPSDQRKQAGTVPGTVGDSPAAGCGDTTVPLYGDSVYPGTPDTPECRFAAGSLRCVNDPCPNPNHRTDEVEF